MYVVHRWLESHRVPLHAHQFHHVEAHPMRMLQLFHQLQAIRVVHPSAVRHLQFQNAQPPDQAQSGGMAAWAAFHLIYRNSQLNVPRP